MPHAHDTVIIIGAGIAGLVAALALPKNLTVQIYANAPLGQGTASNWSQGGVAAAIGPGDTAQLHIDDSLAAAAGIADQDAVAAIVRAAPAAITFLEELGVLFDRDDAGAYALSREAAHTLPRVARVKGDLTGPAIMQALQQHVRQRPNIHLHFGWKILDLMGASPRITGAIVADPQGAVYACAARAVILATGGVGFLYQNTSNPRTAIGEGIAAAARAGAVLSDLEFVQFHPTTMAVGLDPSPLATEALRGEGAFLINSDGERFMLDINPLAELAPRDVVARAIYAQIKAQKKVFLDCRASLGERFAQKFPKVFSLCQEIGIDPGRTPIPVEPAAHYHMGGVATDLQGRSSIVGLWACGEVACTGAHGANRLASNSLLEAIVLGQHAAADIAAHTAFALTGNDDNTPAAAMPVHDDTMLRHEYALRAMLRNWVGVIRQADELQQAQQFLRDLAIQPLSHRLGNMVLVARMITRMAERRFESRGSHYRADAPHFDPLWAKRQFATMSELLAP